MNINFIENNSYGNRRRNSKNPGIVTIVNCDKSKRIELSTLLVSELHIENSIQIGFAGNVLVIRACDSMEKNAFILKKHGKKKVLYSSDAVRQIVEQLGLDFKNKVSLTFYDVELVTYENQTVAKFKTEESDD